MNLLDAELYGLGHLLVHELGVVAFNHIRRPAISLDKIGYVKLAIFIVQLLVENGVQPAVLLAKEETIQTFLKKFVPQEMLSRLQALSILARIGWEEEFRKEAETVAKFVSVSFPQLQRETKKLRDRGVVV